MHRGDFTLVNLRVPEYYRQEEAESIYYPVHSFSRSSDEGEKPNVVLIIMESFSKEYSGYLNGNDGYMPFLDSLMQESLHFPNAFANAKKSLEALPAILASIPALMETPFVSSPYSANKINSLPRQLKNSGYHTSFFHGGINGTMGFDDFARKLNTFPRPFFTCLFSLSSHHPYISVRSPLLPQPDWGLCRSHGILPSGKSRFKRSGHKAYTTYRCG